MGNFYTDYIEHHPDFHSKKEIRAWTLLEPVTRSAFAAIIDEAEAMGVDLMLWETYRSKERQHILHANHATQLSEVGTHHYGLAGDLVRVVDGEPSWKGDFSFLGPLSIKYRLVWGGNWKNRDSYHLQRCSIAMQKPLFSGSWYPAEDYDPLKEDI